MAFQYKVRNPDGTMGEMKKFGDEDTAEEKAARLEQENQLLLSSMREMSTYIANQEQRLAEQEKAYGAFHVNCRGIRRRETKCLMNRVD